MAYTHNVFEPKQMASLNVDSLVRTVIPAADLDNGTLVVLGVPGTTIFGEVEIGAVPCTTASAASDVVAILDGDGNPKENGYDIGQIDPRGFYNVSGKATRARILVAGDEFMIPTAAINGTFVAQGYVTVDTRNAGEMVLADSADGYSFAGKILSRAVPVLFGNTKVDFTLIRVIRNGANATAIPPIPAIPVAANVADEDTANATDLTTAVALANALKVTVNALLGALKTAGLMEADA